MLITVKNQGKNEGHGLVLVLKLQYRCWRVAATSPHGSVVLSVLQPSSLRVVAGVRVVFFSVSGPEGPKQSEKKKVHLFE
jgi:hypothetical protein